MGLVLCLVSLALFCFSPDELLPALAPYHPQLVILLPAAAASLISFTMQRTKLQTPQVYLVIGFWFAIVMSALTKLWLRGSLEAFITFGTVVCIYFVVALNVTTTARLRLVCGALSFFAVIMSVMGIFAYHAGFMGETLLYERMGEGFQIYKRVRALGTFNDPNDFSQFLAVALALLGVFWKKRNSLRNVLVLGPPAAILVYTIYLTGSRGAMFGLAAIIFVIVSKRFGPMQSAFFAGVVVLLMIAAQFGGGRDITLHEERVMTWGTGINMLKHNPIFGIGFQKFTEYSEMTAHNSFVLCFAELGTFGYFFWLALILTTVMSLNRFSKLSNHSPEGERRARLVPPLRAALFAFLATAWFLSRTYNPILFVLVALIGALVNTPEEGEEKLELTPSRWIPTTLAFQLVSVMMIYATIRLRSF